MNKNLKIIVILLLVSVAILVSYLIGKMSSKENFENQTFYATIESINDNSVLVHGLEVNDINYRGKFSFIVKDDTILEWRYTKIAISDFKVGNRISITFNGPILDSYPAQLTNVVKIQILDDKLTQN